jgi:hypothetical protein
MSLSIHHRLKCRSRKQPDRDGHKTNNNVQSNLGANSHIGFVYRNVEGIRRSATSAANQPPYQHEQQRPATRKMGAQRQFAFLFLRAANSLLQRLFHYLLIHYVPPSSDYPVFNSVPPRDVSQLLFVKIEGPLF